MVPDDMVLAMAELSADAVFGKIPENRYLYYIEEALNAGDAQAKKYGGMSVDQLCSELDVSLVVEDKSERLGAVNLRGQTMFEGGRAVIYVYKESIASLAENSSWDGEPRLNIDDALDTHVYHELFHVLEEKSGYVSDSLEPVRLWKFFSHEHLSHITRCSEIAAHRFAKGMKDLPWLPNFYDYIYLYNTGALKEGDFSSFFSRMRALVDKGKGGTP